jgi:hypothetical protein
MKTKREVKYVVVWELKKNKCLLKICLNFVKIAPSHFHPPHFLLFLLFYYLSHTYSNTQRQNTANTKAIAASKYQIYSILYYCVHFFLIHILSFSLTHQISVYSLPSWHSVSFNNFSTTKNYFNSTHNWRIARLFIEIKKNLYI